MKLCRSQDDYNLAGVCGGLAEHLGWDSGKLRIVWVLATIFTAFAGVLIYLALWYLMPPSPAQAAAVYAATDAAVENVVLWQKTN